MSGLTGVSGFIEAHHPAPVFSRPRSKFAKWGEEGLGGCPSIKTSAPGPLLAARGQRGPVLATSSSCQGSRLSVPVGRGSGLRESARAGCRQCLAWPGRALGRSPGTGRAAAGWGRRRSAESTGSAREASRPRRLLLSAAAGAPRPEGGAADPPRGGGAGLTGPRRPMAALGERAGREPRLKGAV